MRARLTYLPLYELIWFVGLLAILLVTAASFVAHLVAPHLFNHFDWQYAFLILVVTGFLLFVFGRHIKSHWRTFTSNGEISVSHRIGGGVSNYPLSSAKQIEVSTLIDAFHGMQTRAVLLLRDKGGETELEITRSLLPHWPFRKKVTHFAQALNIPIYWNARPEIMRWFNLPAATHPVKSRTTPRPKRKQQPVIKVRDYVNATVSGERERPEIEGLAQKLLRTRTEWEATGDGEFPYLFKADGVEWHVRINDFPEDPALYSLMANGRPITDIEHLPKIWKLPETPPVLSADYRAECPRCQGDSGWNGKSEQKEGRLYLQMICTDCGLTFENFDEEHQRRLEY